MILTLTLVTLYFIGFFAVLVATYRYDPKTPDEIVGAAMFWPVLLLAAPWLMLFSLAQRVGRSK